MSWLILCNALPIRDKEFLSLDAYNNHYLNSHSKQAMYAE